MISQTCKLVVIPPAKYKILDVRDEAVILIDRACKTSRIKG